MPVQGSTRVAAGPAERTEEVMEFGWFVGIDWATQEHEVCVVDRGGERLGRRSFKHTGQGLIELCQWLPELTGGAPGEIAVAIELTRGAVVETMLERGFAVYSINPKQLDRFRDRYSVGGAKDDRLDAFVLADTLRTDTARYWPVRIDDARIIELREWVQMRSELEHERVRLTNRMGDQLRRYYPQVLELDPDVGAAWVLELWQRAPTPKEGSKLRRSTVSGILATHRIRRITANEVIEVLRTPPLYVAAGATEAAVAHLGALSERLRLVDRQRKDCERRIEAILDELGRSGGVQEEGAGQPSEHRDVAILDSLPGVGGIVLASLLAHAWQPLRERDYQNLRTLSGVAPVTRRSGKSKMVTMRMACRAELREAVFHWARVATQRDQGCARHYRNLRNHGHNHARALRSVADRLLGIACAMLKNQTVYDSKRHEREAA